MSQRVPLRDAASWDLETPEGWASVRKVGSKTRTPTTYASVGARLL